MQIPLDRRAAEPLYRQIAAFIDHQIVTGNLPAGAMLPSIRTLSARLGVSKTIVSMAYAELEATGRVTGRIGQGTMVTAEAAPPAARAPAPLALPQQAPGSAVLHDLRRVAQQSGRINFTISSPSLEHLPVEDFNRCLRAVLQQDGPDAYAYEGPEGYPPLRQAIARHILGRGITATADQILVTSGGQQAIDLAVRTLVQPGEWVVTESPCYMGALEVFHALGAQVAPAPLDEDGLIVDRLEPLFRRLRPRLLYINPTFQNPTGATLPLERRRYLVELAARWNVVILEDAACSDLELNGPMPPAVRAFGGPVVHVGSFSKSALPGIRIGYVVADTEVVRSLALTKQTTDLHNPGLLQRALTRFLEAGLLPPHLRRVIEVYHRRRDAMLSALRRHFPAEAHWTEPEGGFHIWITLPPEVDVTALYVAALHEGVAFTPGAVFYPTTPPANTLRLSFGAVPPARIEAGVACLGSLIRRGPRLAGSVQAVV